MRSRNCPSSPATLRARGRWVSRRVRCERHQGRPGAGFDLHHAHRRWSWHSANDGALRLFARGGEEKVSILADGGIVKSGDIVKALTLSQAVICGGIFAGCNEAPGDVMEIGGKLYKQYRGMGSFAAMKSGSAARYGQPANPTQKVAAEGIEALKEACGSVDRRAGSTHRRHSIRHGLSRRGEPRATP